MSIQHISNISPPTELKNHAETSKTKTVQEKTDKGISFSDILDVVNPLQHIPIVSTIYRSATGDEISPVSRIIGGAIFGKLFGIISAVVNVVVEAVTGKDIGDHILTALKGNQNQTKNIASSENGSSQIPDLSENKEDKNDRHGEILDATNYIPESLLKLSDTEMEELNPITHSEHIRKYTEAKEILEYSNYQADSRTSIIV